MCLGHAQRAHFEEPHMDAATGELPRRFAAG
jgi:hypothetical protein